MNKTKLLVKVPVDEALLYIFAVMILFRPDPVTGAVLIAFILNLIFKRCQQTKRVNEAFGLQVQELTRRLQEIRLETKAQEAQLETLKKTQSTVAKQAEDTKKLLSENHLANAFVPRAKRQ